MLFLDSSDPKEIKDIFAWGVIAGVTTNPLILAREAGATDIELRIREVLAVSSGPVSVELTTETEVAMMEEAHRYHTWAPSRVVIKVPFSEAGLRVTRFHPRARIGAVGSLEWCWLEGFFRSYKRTLNKVKLLSQTEALVYREVEGSLLAMQLLQAQGVRALAACERVQAKNSVRQMVRLVRQEMTGRGHGRNYFRRLCLALRENRERASAKEKRVWPSRQPHRALRAPNLRTLTKHERSLLNKTLRPK